MANKNQSVATAKRSQIQMERDRVRMGELVAEGYSVPKAAETINAARPYEYTAAMGRMDLDWVRAQWQQTNIESYQLHVATQLLRYERLQAELWDAWRRSKRTKVTKISRTSDNPTNSFTQSTQTDSIGDPNYLKVLTSVLDAQNKILGVYNRPLALRDDHVTVTFVWGDGEGTKEKVIGVYPAGRDSDDITEDAENLLMTGGDDEDLLDESIEDVLELDAEPWLENG